MGRSWHPECRLPDYAGGVGGHEPRRSGRHSCRMSTGSTGTGEPSAGGPSTTAAKAGGPSTTAARAGGPSTTAAKAGEPSAGEKRAGKIGSGWATLALTAARAGHVLGTNSRADGIVRASAGLYPHQWSWDTAFIAIGLAHLDVPLARRNLDALFSGQWDNGMVPHIVFDDDSLDYFPGPEAWACGQLNTGAPEHPKTSGICQPPVHALATTAILRASADQGAGEQRATREWLETFYPKLLAWHRFLQRERVDLGSGLVAIFHGWESGMDNSPRWDDPYSRVRPGPSLPAYERRDTLHVTDPSTRPTGRDYDRYLWLVEEAKSVGYDQARLREVSSFYAGDSFFTAIFAAANEHLATTAEAIGAGEADELRQWAAKARKAVLTQCDPKSGLAADLDLRTGESLRTETIAGFAPLVAGGSPPELVEQLGALLIGPRWAGYPGLRWPLPPSTSPHASSFQPRTYWRGPVWPVMTWLLSSALRSDGHHELAARLREGGLQQLEGPELAEYYEPFSGEPLGSFRQSWTAAAALDWLSWQR